MLHPQQTLSRFLLICLVFSSLQIQAISWKTKLFWGLYGGAALYSAASSRFHFTARKVPRASLEIEEFVRKELAEFDVPNAHKVKVHVHTKNQTPMSALGTDLIFLAQLNAQEIEEKLKIRAEGTASAEVLEKAEATLTIYKSMLAHEAAHLKFKDTTVRLPVARLIIALSNFGIYKMLERIPSVKPYVQTKKAFVALCILTNLGIIKAHRIIEHQADEAMPNDKVLLSAFSRYLAYLHDAGINFLVAQGAPSPKFAELTLNMVDLLHPSLMSRVKRLNERIAALKDEDEMPEGVVAR